MTQEGKRQRLEILKKALENNQRHIPENELKTRYKAPYEGMLGEIA